MRNIFRKVLVCLLWLMIYGINTNELPIKSMKHTGYYNGSFIQKDIRVKLNFVSKQNLPKNYFNNKVTDNKFLHKISSERELDENHKLLYSIDSNENTSSIRRRLNTVVQQKSLTRLGNNRQEKNYFPVQSIWSNKSNALSNYSSVAKIWLRNFLDFSLSKPNSTYLIASESKNIRSQQFIIETFMQAHESFDRRLYNITFNKLLYNSPDNRRVNGISFVQSGLFLQLLLTALTDVVSPNCKTEIEKSIGIHLSKLQKIHLLNKTLSNLPVSNNDVKFYWSYHLVLCPGCNVSQEFKKGIAKVLKLQINSFNGREQPDKIANSLNKMIEKDTGGAIRKTFDDSELSGGVNTILLNTLYIRARWRSAPTVLNGSRPFQDADDAPKRMIRMIRINDIMRFAELREWNAYAVEIFYAINGLSLLMLVPRNRSLLSLADVVAKTNVNDILRKMSSVRVALSLPLYTLRMTLLLPNKLQALGITQLLNNTSTRNSLKISHAVQRLMFWAEAGRNAFKDDGIQWDESPEFELVVDCPYVFFVRWNNLTLMNGNFVL